MRSQLRCANLSSRVMVYPIPRNAITASLYICVRGCHSKRKRFFMSSAPTYVSSSHHLLQSCKHASAAAVNPCRITSPWSSPRPISSSQLHTLLHFHLCPINLIVSKGTYFLEGMGSLISGRASRLDAFSVYPFRAWLPGYALGSPAGAPAVRPSRSSRTKDSSSQISCAHNG